MAITGTPRLERIWIDQFRLTGYGSDLGDPTFYVWVGGEFHSETKALEVLISIPEGHSPVVELYDDPATLPIAYPGRVRLGWQASAGAAQYLIERWTGAEWEFRQIQIDQGQAWFEWQSEWIADGTAWKFRVTPIGQNGQTGEAREFTGLMVRHPDPPAVEYDVDPDTRVVTIDAAA